MKRRTSHRPHLVLAAAARAGARALPAAAAAGGGGELRLGEPYRQQGRVCLDWSLYDFFDDEVLAALESGLPATIVVRWRIWRERPSWWDHEVDAGSARFRIFYDVLEERYDAFDDRGRNIVTADAIDEVEGTLCRDRRLVTIPADELRADRGYYVEVEVRLEPLDEDEIRDLEGWLHGRRDGGQELLSGLAQHAVGFLKDMAGLGSRAVWARTETFPGWE
jgi:hypothetical protein